MGNNLPTPPMLMGSEAEQLVQMRSYLFRISEMLNAAETEREAKDEQSVQQPAINSNASTNAELDDQYNRLKSLIIKTADIVRGEMSAIESDIRAKYIAKSEWGNYEENIQAKMNVTAQNVVQSYDYDSRISSVEDGVAGFEAYKLQTSGYIQSGIIGYDDDGHPVIGIAIGQNVRSTEVVIDGQVYAEIDMTKNLATYTSDKITFWQNGIEVAYISNSEMGITGVRVNNKITLGNDWEISRTNGFTVKWIGGSE